MYFIDYDGVTIHGAIYLGGGTTRDSVKLTDGREVDSPGNRLFAIHPKDNPRCSLVDGVWHYRGSDNKTIAMNGGGDK